jgi:transcriptional regulator of met regulon
MIKNPKTICLTLELEHLDLIKEQAMFRSIQEGRVIEANQLMREALIKAFPMPQQMDMLGEVK